MTTIIKYLRQQKSTLSAGIFLLLLFPLSISAQSLTDAVPGEIRSCQLSVFGITTNATCPETNNGVVQATPGSGAAPYTYAWNTGETTQALSDLSPGTYTVTVTDSQGCEGSTTFVVEDTPIPLLYVDLADPFCQHQSATFTAEAGYGHYQWELNDPADSITEGQGTYAVTVKWGASSAKNIRCDFNNASDQCTGTVIFNAVVEACVTSVNSTNPLADVSIFPNPVTNMLELQTGTGFPANTSLQLRDVNGKLMLQSVLDNSTYTSLEMNQLNPGVYFLYLQGGSAMQTWRVLKQ